MRFSQDGRRVVASIEARMGSSRLPGKVLMDINGKPALWRLVDRLRRCNLLDDIVVATTKANSDDLLYEACQDYGVKCYRGSEGDVLERVVEAHVFMDSDIVVEITGDCPLTDPKVVDLGIETYLSHAVDVVTNCGNSLTWPMGQYVQVFSLDLLAKVEREVHDPAVREHVSLFFYENPDKFQIIELLAPYCWRRPDWRMQLDYPEDLLFQIAVYRNLEYLYGPFFGINEAIKYLDEHPEIVNLNIHCREKSAR